MLKFTQCHGAIVWGIFSGTLWGTLRNVCHKDVASEEDGDDPTHYWQHVSNKIAGECSAL